jgi:type IV secretion system protein VirB9
MTADKLHFDWQSNGYAKLLPARVFDDGDALYMAWNRETPLPAILTMSEDRKEGPLNYRMSGEYVVITPVPQNLVLRYGNRSAALWPTRRIAPSAPKPVSAPPPAQIAQSAPATQPTPPPAVKLANVAALYNDKLTDSRQ